MLIFWPWVDSLLWYIWQGVVKNSCVNASAGCSVAEVVSICIWHFYVLQRRTYCCVEELLKCFHENLAFSLTLSMVRHQKDIKINLVTVERLTAFIYSTLLPTVSSKTWSLREYMVNLMSYSGSGCDKSYWWQCNAKNPSVCTIWTTY